MNPLEAILQTQVVTAQEAMMDWEEGTTKYVVKRVFRLLSRNPTASIKAAPLREENPMPFPLNKTKIVATIGPASDSPAVLQQLILAGMNVARLNFSHGDFSGHAETITRIRAAAQAVSRRVAIMADLPGPKIRIGKFKEEPVYITPGDRFTLSTDDVVGTAQRVSVSLPALPRAVKAGELEALAPYVAPTRNALKPVN